MLQLILFILGCALGAATQAIAAMPNTFGFGPLSISMGATSLFYDEQDPYYTYTNPAALGGVNQTIFSYGMQNMEPNLKPFGTVVINESGTQGTFNSAGIFGGSGQNIALALPIGKKTRPFTIGVAAYLSRDSLTRVSGNPVNFPFYPIYQDISRNAFFLVGMGYRIYGPISVGVSLGSTLLSLTSYTLRSDSSVDFSASATEVRSVMKSSYAILYDFDRTDLAVPLELGFMYRAQSGLETRLTADITAVFPVSGELTSFPAFSPAEWVLSGSTRPWQWNTLSFDLSYVRWSEYMRPFGSGNINFLVIGDGKSSANFKDVWTSHIGWQYSKPIKTKILRDYAIRAGYFYYPTPVPSQTANTNFVDNDRHTFSVGGGAAFLSPWEINNVIHLDAFFQYNYLVERKTSKDSATDIGAPGYTTGGNILTYGMNLSFYL